MPYYGVASGRQTGVYDNWEDCKDQVNRYSHNDYKRFDTPDQAYDFVEQRSSRGNHGADFNKATAYSNSNNQVVPRGYQQEASSYHRTDYMKGKNSDVVRERTVVSGRNGREHFIAKGTCTYWKEH